MTYAERFTRNRGFISATEQARLAAAVVGIAGAGGDGGHAALTLARLGVQRFRLADPEDFELENTNRQAGCNVESIGRNKAMTVAAAIRLINPEASVDVFEAGVTADNVAGFVAGCDAVLDETEYTQPAVGVMIAQVARVQQVPVLMALNIGFGCLVTTFAPRSPWTLERYLGLPADIAPDSVKATDVPLWRWVPRLPAYAHESVLRAVQAGEIATPSVAPGVALAAGVLATETFNCLTRRRRPVLAPRAWCLDALERRAGYIRWRPVSSCASLARLVVRSRLGRNTDHPDVDARAATPQHPRRAPASWQPPGPIKAARAARAYPLTECGTLPHP